MKKVIPHPKAAISAKGIPLDNFKTSEFLKSLKFIEVKITPTHIRDNAIDLVSVIASEKNIIANNTVII
ncbi:MAG: hypothetical protein WCJ19_03300 [bacterium]